ncbi:hypothetical protein OUZ56_014722 [Daphnia magna]|uniref:Uncharacterized protein n=1 Tax=Daphnia magna TaxID=35525 RepID=A0ABR0AKL9_9CRUS|nr:hypothetical protein OUZ56_014722 [Daphnia magna]
MAVGSCKVCNHRQRFLMMMTVKWRLPTPYNTRRVCLTSGLAKWQRKGRRRSWSGSGGALAHFLAQLAVEITRAKDTHTHWAQQQTNP